MTRRPDSQTDSSARLLAAARTLGVDALAAETIEALRAAGVRSILLKGPALAGWLYGDGALREYGDCDLLVDPADTDRAAVVLRELGFRPFAQEQRLPELTSVWLPDGVDDAKVRTELRTRFGIEVGSGLGEFAGKGWRIGLMGHSARERSVVSLLGALEALL